MNQNQNQFAQKPVLGQVDLVLSVNTISVETDGPLVAGTPVKVVDTAGKLPLVEACTSDTDQVFGYVNYNQKNAAWVKGQPVEVSIGGNAMYLSAVGAVARGTQVVLNTSVVGGASQSIGTGATLIGWAFDKAEDGELFRVVFDLPSYALDADPCSGITEALPAALLVDQSVFCDYVIASGGTVSSAAALACSEYGPLCPDCQTLAEDFFSGNNDMGYAVDQC